MNIGFSTTKKTCLLPGLLTWWTPSPSVNCVYFSQKTDIWIAGMRIIILKKIYTRNYKKRNMCTKGIHSQVSMEPLINTLSQPSVNHQSTLHRHLHVGWHSIDTPLTSWSTAGWQSPNFQSMHVTQSLLGRLSTNCWSSVDQVSTVYWSGCRSSTDQDVDRGYQSRVSIDTQLLMPLVRMIPEDNLTCLNLTHIPLRRCHLPGHIQSKRHLLFQSWLDSCSLAVWN